MKNLSQTPLHFSQSLKKKDVVNDEVDSQFRSRDKVHSSFIKEDDAYDSPFEEGLENASESTSELASRLVTPHAKEGETQVPLEILS